jgi:hypothetical protein
VRIVVIAKEAVLADHMWSAWGIVALLD